jgi:hypothetical protein
VSWFQAVAAPLARRTKLPPEPTRALALFSMVGVQVEVSLFQALAPLLTLTAPCPTTFASDVMVACAWNILEDRISAATAHLIDNCLIMISNIRRC